MNIFILILSFIQSFRVYNFAVQKLKDTAEYGE